MHGLSVDTIRTLEASCAELEQLDEVRHAAIINHLGRAVAGGTKKGVTPLIDDEKIKTVYMQLNLDIQMRKEMDDLLGKVDYVVSKRDKVLIISIPIGDHLLLISAEPESDDKKILKKAHELFNNITL